MSDHDDDERRSVSVDRRSNSDRGSVDRRDEADQRSTSRGRDRTNSRDDDKDKSRGGPLKPGISLLVRNLNKSTSADDVKEVFGQHGEVRDVYTPLDFYTKESRGFAFVEFVDLESAENAIREMDGRELDGNRLTVVMAQEKRKTPQEMRRRDRNVSPPRRRDTRRDRSRSRDRSRDRRDRRRSPPRRSPRRRSRSRSPVRRRSSPPPRSRHRSRS
ncbi:Aste57867_22331 [Aphanomyces stellatus]|uniref:Aste57867_22331 protein n=1 Tax=Aphanomyces stellatus TaxID=120398 RepID=A0A485LK32_9STRA|nr:hypothetical protein As57867_022261 [Aphanomyces stellatus]VFT98994.1 Aste57867_22331 [Aphanomyces stellatus]